MNTILDGRLWDGESLYYDISFLKLMEANIFSFADLVNHPKLIFQQKLEMTDMNGKPIYQGDIIRYNNRNYEVIDDKHGIGLFGPIWFLPPYINSVKHLKLVGNKMENKDLFALEKNITSIKCKHQLAYYIEREDEESEAYYIFGIINAKTKTFLDMYHDTKMCLDKYAPDMFSQPMENKFIFTHKNIDPKEVLRLSGYVEYTNYYN
jgi:hypothetical protein